MKDNRKAVIHHFSAVYLLQCEQFLLNFVFLIFTFIIFLCTELCCKTVSMLP